MAAPTIRGWAAATNSADMVPAFAVTLPTRVAGDLLIAFVACDTIATAITRTQTTAWPQISEEAGGQGRLAIYARIATNDANDNLTVAGPNNNDGTCNIVAITAGTHNVVTPTTDIVVVASATSTTGNANPPSIDGGSAKDWLALAIAAVDLTATGSTISAAPTNYTTSAILQKSAASTSSVALGVGPRALTAATTEDPGTFTNTSGAWIAKTLLIPPAIQDGAVNGTVSWVGSVTGKKVCSGEVLVPGITWGASLITGEVPAAGPSEGSVSGAISWVGSVTGIAPVITGQSVRFDNIADRYSRAVTGLSSTSFTMACWGVIDVNTAGYTTFMGADDATSTWCLIQCPDGNSPVWTTSGGDITTGIDMTVGDWYFFAASYTAGGTSTFYWAVESAGSLSSASSAAVTGISATHTFWIGHNGWLVEPLNGRIADVKVWAAALTLAEIEAERESLYDVVRTADLWAHYSFESGPQTNDESGNGRTLTSNGTPTAEAGPTGVTGGANEGAVIGAISWVGSVTGTNGQEGSVSGAISRVGSVTGVRTPKAAVNGAISLVGTVTGVRVSRAAANGAISWVGSVIGESPPDLFGGSVNGAITRTGSVTGKRLPKGSVSGAITRTGFVIGGALGIVIGAISRAGSVTGKRVPKAAANGAITRVGTVTGFKPVVGMNDGSVNGTVTWAGSAIGKSVHKGLVTGSVVWVGAVVGEAIHEGLVTGTIVWVGIVEGPSAPPVGYITGEISGPGLVTRVVKGPAIRRLIKGPNLSRVLVGPNVLIETSTGPSHTTHTMNGPDVSRTTTGPGTSRTNTGPET